jgi:phosphoribosylanthranilate isomerase
VPELLRKVCGLTRPEDVALCHELGAEFTGFIFAEKSFRCISPEAAAALPKGPSLRVGVFAGAASATGRDTARTAGLDLVQLHGGEDPAFCRSLGPERVIKTLWPERLSPQTLTLEIERFAPVCAYYLLDAGSSGGGSGKRLAWCTLARIAFPRPWLLAGGLGPKTLLPALAACTPGGVDMNSALESVPGVKDHALLRKAFDLLTGRPVPTAGHTSETRV